MMFGRNNIKHNELKQLSSSSFLELGKRRETLVFGMRIFRPSVIISKFQHRGHFRPSSLNLCGSVVATT